MIDLTLEAGEDALDIPSSEDLLRTPVSKATSGKRKADEFSTAHKNSSKRSLDDAGLEETDLVSPPSSPGNMPIYTFVKKSFANAALFFRL